MVSPEHIDNQKSEDQQAPSPAVEQQLAAGGEKKRPWLKPLMRGAAIVLSLVGSFAIVWFLPSLGLGGLAVPEGLLLGLVSAFLFRSWWAILVIPIAFIAGELLAIYLTPLVFSPNPYEIDDTGLGVFLWAIIGPITAIIGALFGTFIYQEGTGTGSETMSNSF